jgi:autoinducer 2-degrading protein
MQQRFACLVHITVRPETRAAFLGAISADAIGSRREPGCLRFDVLQDEADPNKYTFIEVYSNAGPAVEFHRAQPHYKAWAEFKKKHGVVSQTVAKCAGIMYTPETPRSKL